MRFASQGFDPGLHSVAGPGGRVWLAEQPKVKDIAHDWSRWNRPNAEEFQRVRYDPVRKPGQLELLPLGFIATELQLQWHAVCPGMQNRYPPGFGLHLVPGRQHISEDFDRDIRRG